jgi:hypothetical protein
MNTTSENRLYRHEAAHVVAAWLIDFQAHFVRIGAMNRGGGFVSIGPDYRRRLAYGDVALSPFVAFMAAGVDDFDRNGYLGPLPTSLPAHGARAVADCMAILLAGYCGEGGDPEGHYIEQAQCPCSDASQIEVLVGRYRETAVIRDRLIVWLANQLGGSLADVVAEVADALWRPGGMARASWLGLEDLESIREEHSDALDEASSVLDAYLNGLAFLAEHARRTGGQAAA